MFCSNCGKTIRPDDEKCPNCGAVIGEGRFPGSMYTSAQVRVESQAADEASSDGRLVASYTRTDYMSYDKPQEENVYSGTTYRPLLREEEALDAQEPAKDFEASFENKPERARAETPSDADESTPPADAPAEPKSEAEEPLDLPPLKPVRKGVIRPEVERYMEMLDSKEPTEKPRPIVQLPFGRKSKPEAEAENEPLDEGESEPPVEAARETSDETASAPVRNTARRAKAPAAQDGYLDEEDEDEETPPASGFAPIRALAERLNLNGKKLANALIVSALIVVFIVGGAVWLGYVISAGSSKIAGVSPNVYQKGIEMLSAHVTDDYRASFIEDYLANTATANAQLSEEAAAFNSLLPDSPQEYDQLFINGLLNVQDAIGTALKQDADAQLSGADITEISTNAWTVINHAVATLTNASNITAVTAMDANLSASVVPTPTPAPSATPVTYTTLSNGMLDSVEVKRMQYRLINLGYLNGEADGDFGNMTETAVKAFQNAAGLTATGIADSNTQIAMYDDNAPRAATTAATATPTAPPES